MSCQPSLALKTIQNLAHQSALEVHEPGDVIFRADDAGDCIYAIIEGVVEIFWGPDIYERLQPGCCFGFDVMIDTSKRRYCTAIAVDSVKLLPLDRERFLLAIQEFPLFALETLHIMDQRLRDIRSR